MKNDNKENLVHKIARKSQFLNKAAYVILAICIVIALVHNIK